MDLPRPDVDPDGLLELSVVYTDRALNHMSQRFLAAMQQTVEILRETYAAHTVALVPGGGTAAMEAVARQLGTGQRILIVRNGLFSYRWSQIIDAGEISDDVTVCLARPDDDSPQSAWRPAPVEQVVPAIREQRPGLVCMPHVETAAGMLLPHGYLRAVADATHEVGGLVVLDCIASGALWVDMATVGVDVLVSAPQKGWSGQPGAGYVMLSEAAREAVQESASSSFLLDLKTWLGIAEAYVAGQTPYHATMPTDSIAHNAAVLAEAREHGLRELQGAQVELGTAVRSLLASRGFASVAAPEFASPSVVVVHTDDPDLNSGAAFKRVGVQVAGGVPLQCGEPETWSTFRIGLFGLDKLADAPATVRRLEDALDRMAR